MAGPLGNWDWRTCLPASLDLSRRLLGLEYSACVPRRRVGRAPRSYDRYLAILALGGAAFG